MLRVLANEHDTGYPLSCVVVCCLSWDTPPNFRIASIPHEKTYSILCKQITYDVVILPFYMCSVPKICWSGLGFMSFLIGISIQLHRPLCFLGHVDVVPM